MAVYRVSDKSMKNPPSFTVSAATSAVLLVINNTGCLCIGGIEKETIAKMTIILLEKLRVCTQKDLEYRTLDFSQYTRRQTGIL